MTDRTCRFMQDLFINIEWVCVGDERLRLEIVMLA